jgi:hypothetical protein
MMRKEILRKCVLQKLDVMARSGLLLLGIATSAGSYEHGD